MPFCQKSRVKGGFRRIIYQSESLKDKNAQLLTSSDFFCSSKVGIAKSSNTALAIVGNQAGAVAKLDKVEYVNI